MSEHSASLNEAARSVARGLQRGALNPVTLACSAFAVDLPVYTVAFWFALYGSFANDAFLPWAAAVWSVCASLVFVATMVATNTYRSAVMASFSAFSVSSCFGLAGPICLLVLFLQPANSFEMLANLTTCAIVVTLPIRFAAQVVMRWVIDTGLVARRAVVAGGGIEAEKLIRGLNNRPTNDINLVGIFDDRDDLRSPTQILGVPKIGGYPELVSFVRAAEIDMVIIALPYAAEKRIEWLLDAFRVLPVEVGLSTYSSSYAFDHPGRAPIFKTFSRSFSPKCRLTKRVFDLFFAVLALSLLWPVMLITAVAVRLDSPGPIFFRQPRHGYNNQIIHVLKFRSMYTDMSDVEAKQVVTRNDPRVTRVGRFIRRSSIDELPQLFNVLKGDLSLVGPRPHAVNAQSSKRERFSQIVEGYSARHRLPPGITGWAQINGWRGEIDTPEKLEARFEHDLYYIENWSFWFDLKILLRTPLVLLRSKGAY